MSKEQKYIGFHNIHTYQTVGNETYLGGINSDGDNVMMVFTEPKRYTKLCQNWLSY